MTRESSSWVSIVLCLSVIACVLCSAHGQITADESLMSIDSSYLDTPPESLDNFAYDIRDEDEYGEDEYSEDYDNDEMRNLHSKKGKKMKKKKMVKPQPVNPVTPVLPAFPHPPVSVPFFAHSAVPAHQQLSCPPGHTMINNNCVITQVIPGEMGCPSGYVPWDNQCIQYARGNLYCPTGFHLTGNRCTQSEIVSPELMCEEGVLDSGGVCVVQGQSGVACPEGFVLTLDKQCTQVFPATKSCPEGYEMHKHFKDGRFGLKGGSAGMCVQNHKVEATLVCPSGTQMDSHGKKCFSMKPNKPRCPKGYKMSHDSTKCLQKVNKVLTACPPGFQEFSKHKAVCEKVIEIPPLLSCPTGATLSPTTGQCEMEMHGASSCPAGYVQSPSQLHLCEKFLPKLGSCPPGTSPVGYGASLECQTAVEHELIECCPPGFELLFGKCERTEISHPVNNCEGQCETVQTFHPELLCPEEYPLVGGHCLGRESQACNEQLDVPSECEIYISTGSRSLRASDVEQIPANCLTVVEKRSVLCPTERISPQIVCPSGAQYENGMCVLRVPLAIHLQSTCRVGVLDASGSQCRKVTRVPIKTECPDGTTRVGTRCVSYERHAPVLSCPPSSAIGSDGQCVIHAPLSVAAPQVLRTAPIPVCPSGTLQGALCYDVERIPRQFVCPTNSVPASRHMKDITFLLDSSEFGKYCIEVADYLISPPHKKFTKAQRYCPDGNHAIGKHCHSHNKVSPISTCPPGTTANGDLCARFMPPVMTAGHVRSSAPAPFCPPGTATEGSTCVARQEAPVEVVCPPNFQLLPNGYGEKQCGSFAPMVLSCPPGTTQTLDGCLQSKRISPTVSVIRDAACMETQTCLSNEHLMM